jgi:putative endonuclease
MKNPFVYIMANRYMGVLYVGVTSNLLQRVAQHKESTFQGFTSKYNAHKLVYFEQHETMESAIVREKQMKKWNRQWKVELISRNNPRWDDLYDSII